MSNASNLENKAFTKECVTTALLQLIKEKPYNKITISEIAEKAGVSRNAIYRNYKSKDMIIKEHIKDISTEFVAQLKKAKIKSHREYIAMLFEHLCAQKELAKTLTDAGLSDFILCAFMKIKGAFEMDHSIKDYYENYRIGGIFFIYATWINNGCKESTEELIEIVYKVQSAKSIMPKI